MNLVTSIALAILGGIFAALAAFGGIRAAWRGLGRRRGAFAALAALAAACTILAQKTSISFDRLISDAGSYATNDVLHVAATNAGAYAAFDFSDSDLLVYRRERGLTNAADWVECLPRRKYGDLPADWHVPDATNYDYLVAVDYVPPSPVHTNGVFELRGFVVPSAAAGTRSAAFATSTIADRREIVPVEYIESDRSCLVDTGVDVFDSTDFDITMCFLVPKAYDYVTLWAESQDNCEAWIYSNRTLATRVKMIRLDDSSKVDLGVVYDYHVAGRNSATIRMTLNDHACPARAIRWIADHNMMLFGGYNNSGGAWRCYYVQLRKDGLLVRDFIPVRVGRAGYLFDRVSGEYLPFGNKGTGSFVLGPDIKE